MNEDHKVASMVCGIVGCSLAFVSFFIFGWLSFAAIVLGIIALALHGGAAGKATGLVSLIVGSIFGFIYILQIIGIFNNILQ